MTTTGPNPCHLCGKDVRHVRYMVEMYNGGSTYRMMGEPAPDDRDPGYCGWYPVGSNCVKLARKLGYHVEDLTRCGFQPPPTPAPARR